MVAIFGLAFACCSQPGGSAPGSDATAGIAADAALARLDFEQLELGSPPAGWTPAETKGQGKLARWAVAAAPGGGRALLVETGNAGGTFNLLLSPQEFPADLSLSVRLRAEKGAEDQGGGLVWRARDADNYYVARWNPLEDNVRIYKVERGERSLFQNNGVHVEPDGWHELTVEVEGERMTVALDGVPLLDTQDATFFSGGRAGLWTKADAATWFDDLVVRLPCLAP